MTILRWSNVAGKAAFHAARTTLSRKRPGARHGHDFAELFWIDAGKGTHLINKAALPLQPGSFVFMRPEDCHGFESTGREDLTITNIAFSHETLDFLGRRYFGGRKTAFWHSEPLPVAHQIDTTQRRRFNRWADDLAQAPRTRFYVERFLLNVLGDLNRERSDAALDDVPEWLAHACRAMQKPEHFHGGVQQFLRLCGRSREHVARSARLHLGTSPTDYVNRIRMAHAMRQLEMGSRDILEIALDCGIENLSHFYSLFRTQTGMTPRAYRLAHRKPL